MAEPLGATRKASWGLTVACVGCRTEYLENAAYMFQTICGKANSTAEHKPTADAPFHRFDRGWCYLEMNTLAYDPANSKGSAISMGTTSCP